MKLNSLSLWKRLSLASAFAVSGSALAIGAALPAVHASNHYSCYYNCYSNYSSYVGNNSSDYYNNSPFFPLSTLLAGVTSVSEDGYGGASSAPIDDSTSAATTDNCNSSYRHSYCYSNYDNSDNNNSDNNNSDNNNSDNNNSHNGNSHNGNSHHHQHHNN